VLAHPDDESLGFGGALVRYGSEGIETSLVTATLGQKGRYRGLPPSDPAHPGTERIAAMREAELRAACEVIGIRDLALLGYMDGALDQVDPAEVIGRIAHHLRRVRPHVVLTFGPEGAYGHPDHIAISQFTGAAIVRAADPTYQTPGEPLAPHAVSKLYWRVSTKAEWDVYESVIKKLVSVVDGVERQAVPWPDWQITTTIDTRAQSETVWRAVSCHTSQVGSYEKLHALPPDQQAALWGAQQYYRVFSIVNGGRAVETDMFAGLRD
jgi:LmbE family N-acetylglucosaminyl deacetylase